MSLNLPYSNEELLKLLRDTQTVLQALLGGASGQVLGKSAEADYAMAWQDPPEGGGGTSLPGGGTAGQVLTKQSDAEGDAAWAAPTGEKGEPGTTPHIGDNGNWWIGETDTGIAAQGPDGPAGVSPAITENPGNSATSYKLDISTKAGSFTTPNLQAVSFVENAQVYSTEETVVGTWSDGKPIYRLTVVGALGSNVTTGAAQNLIRDVSDKNIDECVSLQGGWITSAGSWMPFGTTTQDQFVYVFLSTGTRLYERHSHTSSNDVSCRIVLEYTKTTDEATIAIASIDELNAAYEEGVQTA